MIRAAICSLSLVLGFALASDVAHAGLIEGWYSFLPQASEGAAPPAEGLFFHFSLKVGPIQLFTVEQGGPCHCGFGNGISVGPLVLFNLNYSPTDSHWMFVGIGDRTGLEYIGTYESTDAKPGAGTFTLEYIP
jgi:hypothetical protein